MSLIQKFDINGKMLSPTLSPGKSNYLIDIDGTICEDIPNEEPERMKTAKVLPGALAKVNGWFDEGHIITFFTSRTELHREYTENWLKEHGFKYHGIIFGKPRGGQYIWVDDREISVIRVENGFK